MPYGTGKQLVSIGTQANDGTGDSLRAGADKLNDNFTEVYSALGNGSQLVVNTSGAATGHVLRWNGSDFVPQHFSNLTSTLNTNNFNIISTGGNSINLVPDGVGDVSLSYGGQTAVFDGTTGQAQFSSSISYKNEYSTVGAAPSLASNKGYFFTVNGDRKPKVHLSAGGGTGDITADLITNYSSIDELTDVDITTNAPTLNQVLKWDGTKFIPGDDAAGAATQNLWSTIAADTGSTTTDSPTDTLTVAGGTNVTTAISGDTLTVNVDGNFELSELTDVNFTSVSRGDTLTYDPQGNGATAAWVNQPSPTIWYIISVGLNNNSYLIEGPGQAQADDPTLHLYRGFTYIFVNNAGSNHPFRFQSTQGLSGAQWTLGVSGSQTATQIFTVPHSAPNTLYYQCTIHTNMAGTLLIK